MSEHVVMRLVRSVTVSNPVPFMAVCLLVFAFGCFALVATMPHDLFAVAILLGGFISLVAGVTSALYGLFRHPDLMRSERFHVMNRFLDLHGDDRVPLHHTRLSETMLRTNPGQ